MVQNLYNSRRQAHKFVCTAMPTHFSILQKNGSESWTQAHKFVGTGTPLCGHQNDPLRAWKGRGGGGWTLLSCADSWGATHGRDMVMLMGRGGEGFGERIE